MVSVTKLLAIALCLIVSLASGQALDSASSKVTGLRIGYTYNRANQVEIGYGIGKITNAGWDDVGIGDYSGVFVNLGCSFTANKSLLVTKVSYERMGLPIGARLSMVYYSNFHQNQLIALPEVGFNFTTISVTYGYGFDLSKNTFELGPHAFNVSFIPYWKFRTRK